jgi:hypothetical protein
MKRLLHARGTLAAMVGILVVLAAGGGYALASGAGTIKACVHNRSHTLYVGKCHKGDSHLQLEPGWAARGWQQLADFSALVCPGQRA